MIAEQGKQVSVLPKHTLWRHPFRVLLIPPRAPEVPDCVFKISDMRGLPGVLLLTEEEELFYAQLNKLQPASQLGVCVCMRIVKLRMHITQSQKEVFLRHDAAHVCTMQLEHQDFLAAALAHGECQLGAWDVGAAHLCHDVMLVHRLIIDPQHDVARLDLLLRMIPAAGAARHHQRDSRAVEDQT